MANKIKLFIYDKFFDAFSELPQAIQKKTREFIKKFRENPTSSAINYEKIVSFKDPFLRTVRIDQTYRAIIRAPKEGDSYHLLWVDHHDEAMAWAKNKVFEWNRETQSAQVYEIEEKVVQEIVTKKPQADKKVFADYSEEKLLKIGVPKILLPPVSEIRNLDDLEKLQNSLPVDAFDNLFYLFDGIHIDTIINEIEEAIIKETTENTINSQRNFVFISDDSSIDEMLSGDFKKWKVFLHPSQNIVAYSNFKGTVKVSGGAGTGKTIAALHRAKFLTHKLNTDNKPIFFTTYTTSLVKNLNQLIDELLIDKTKLIINNIHSFATEFGKKVKLINEKTRIITDDRDREIWSEVLDFNVSKFEEDFLKCEYNDVILHNNINSEADYLKTARLGRSTRIGRKDKIEIWDLVVKYKEKQVKENKISFNELLNSISNYLQDNPEQMPFSHVICDELQDFSNIELRFIRSLTEDGENDLFLVGDPLQNIYDKRLNFSSCGINIKGKKSKRLKVNYRTTEEIKRLAINTIKNIAFDNFEGEDEEKKGYISLLHGNTPVYKVFKAKKDEADFIINQIKSFTSTGKIKLNEVCIAARTKNQLDYIKEQLFSEHIPFINLADGAEQKSDDKLIISTFHNTKGLEFKAVFLTGVTSGNVPYKPGVYNTWDDVKKRHHEKSEAALMYVAMTRAIQELVITGVGDKCELIGIN